MWVDATTQSGHHEYIPSTGDPSKIASFQPSSSNEVSDFLNCVYRSSAVSFFSSVMRKNREFFPSHKEAALFRNNRDSTIRKYTIVDREIIYLVFGKSRE